MSDPQTDYQALMRAQDIRSNFGDIFCQPEFTRIFRKTREKTMTSVERMYDLFQTVVFVSEMKIPGDIVECGVWKGGSMMLVAETLKLCGNSSRELYLYDTFSGLPEPAADETDFEGRNSHDWWETGKQEDGTSSLCRASEEEVWANMRESGYPTQNIHLIKGMIENTLVHHPMGGIAIARLDTDWYSGAVVGLDQLWPRIVEGGFLIIDDYGSYPSQRRAVDEYFSRTKWKVKLTRIDYSCRVAQKIGWHR